MLGRSLFLAALLYSTLLFAEPRQWDANGVPVRAVSVLEDYSSVSREDGTTLIVWSTSDSVEPVVRGQLFASDGDELWPEGGMVLAQGAKKAAYPAVASVNGGWVIVWFDAEYFAWCDRLDGGWCISSALRVIKVNDAGAPVWAGGRLGVEVAPETAWWEVRGAAVYPSGNGCIVAWQSESQQVAQFFDGQGQAVWPTPVNIPADMYWSKADQRSDLYGGMVYAWYALEGGDTLIRANRISPDGLPMWNGEAGVIVASSDTWYYDLLICGDGLGGAYVVWRDANSTRLPRAQRIEAFGELVWPSGGIALPALTGAQTVMAAECAFDGGSPDGLIAVVQQSAAPNVIVAQKLSLAGALEWGTDGAVICETENYLSEYQAGSLQSDNSGGAYYCHQEYVDAPVFGSYLLASHVAGDGSLTWEGECGVHFHSLNHYYQKFTFGALTEDAIEITWFEGAGYESGISVQRLAVATGDPQYDEPRHLASGDDLSPSNWTVVPLSNGSTATLWQSWASTLYEIRFQIQNVFGERQLDEAGLPLILNDDGTPRDGRLLSSCPDGSGGFFAVIQTIDGATNVLRTVHVGNAGQFLSDAGGEVVFEDSSIYDYDRAYCCADGAGGCFVMASVYDAEFFLISLTMRVDALCQPMWAEPVAFDSHDYDNYSLAVVPSAENSCIILYSRYHWPTGAIRAAQITAAGATAWDVVVTDSVLNITSDAVLCSDRQNGAFAIWIQYNEEQTEYQLRANRVLPSGVLDWQTEGRLVTLTPYWPTGISCDADNLSNLTVAWSEYFSSQNIYAQRLNADGVLQWPEEGLTVCDAANDQYSPRVIAISDNEIYVTWEDMRNATGFWWDTDVYATHLNARGQIRDDSYWQPNGSPVCNYSYYQRHPLIVNDGMGGVQVVWEDQRTSFDYYYSLFSQRLYDPIFTDAGELPVVVTEFALEQNYPNPFNPETVIEFSLPSNSQTSLEVFDVTGRLVKTLVNEQMTAGKHSVTFSAAELPSGVYFYSLRADGRAMTKKMVMIK